MFVTCLLVGGPEYAIEISGVTYLFEMHSRLGPLPITELGHKHEFWRVASLWVKQGKSALRTALRFGRNRKSRDRGLR